MTWIRCAKRQICQLVSRKWKVESGKWKVESEKWKVESTFNLMNFQLDELSTFNLMNFQLNNYEENSQKHI